VSSLLHVLVVTPVIFFWLQERRLGLQHETLPGPTSRAAPSWRPIVLVVAVLVLAMVSAVVWRQTRLKHAAADVSTGQVVQTVRAEALQIAILSPTGTLHQGRNAFTIEFRSANGQLVDVGAVRASGNMPMPGMVMSGGLEVHRTTAPGRYEATAEFGMAGAWHMAIEWDGPAGHGSVTFEGAVQ
jgi:YtkA-like